MAYEKSHNWYTYNSIIIIGKLYIENKKRKDIILKQKEN